MPLAHLADLDRLDLTTSTADGCPHHLSAMADEAGVVA